jgi:hypothetical protein
MSCHASNLKTYTRLFSDLPALQAEQQDLTTLSLLMRDAGVRLPASDERNYAGLTYLGQFIVHDVTREKLSDLNRRETLLAKIQEVEDLLNSRTDITPEHRVFLEQKIAVFRQFAETVVNPTSVNPEDLNNVRTSLLDLDAVYGEFNEYLGADGKFAIGKNAVGDLDLPRDTNGVAMIGDPRNDENRLTAGIHLGFLLFHNKVFIELQAADPTKTIDVLIAEAKTIVIKHYHFIVIHEFLVEIISPEVLATLVNLETYELNLNPVFTALEGKLPLEFVGAAMRWGHSAVRNGYYLNEQFDLFPIFDPIIPDLRGFRAMGDHQPIDWSMFFPMPCSKGFQEWEGIDPFVVSSLFNLPAVVTNQEINLPLATLRRGLLYGLPCAQDLARSLGIPESDILSRTNGNLEFYSLQGPIPDADRALLDEKFGDCTPLFYYILHEALVFHGGETLGPLGSTIVGSVLLHLLNCNQLNGLNDRFVPVTGQFGCVETGRYYMSELLTYAFDLPPFTAADLALAPSRNVNCYDQHTNGQYKIALKQVHPLQATIQPDLIPEIPLVPFCEYCVGQFDPTLILGIATQADVDLVAANARRLGVNPVSAVVKFIANRSIEAIAQGLLPPFAKKIPEQLGIVPRSTVPIAGTITCNQLRGKAFTKTLNEALRYTVEEATAALPSVQQEIADALGGTIPPVTVDVNSFLKEGDVLVD